MSEYNCCHGAAPGPHSPTCPYDKLYWGPSGVQPSRWGHPAPIDFYAAGGSMSNRHGENSAYAQQLRARASERAQIQTGGESAGEAAEHSASPKGAAGAHEEKQLTLPDL